MNYLTPIIGPQWSDLSQRMEENASERHTRFDAAQGRQLFAWDKCEACKEWFRKVVGHECAGKESNE